MPSTENGSSNPRYGGSEDVTTQEIAVYDRQIRLWGLDAQMRMKNASILVIGLGALSAEIIKNIVLAGIGSITIVDDRLVTVDDLSANFFLSNNDIGKPRGASALPRISTLNPLVTLSVINKPLSEISEVLTADANFSLVVSTETNYQESLMLNNLTRELGIGFYSASLNGLYAFAFVDLISHEFKIERPLNEWNTPTVVGSKEGSSTVVSVSTTTDSQGKQSESVIKKEVYLPLQDIKFSDSCMAKFNRRQLAKQLPAFPAAVASWKEAEEFAKSVIEMTSQLGMPVGLATTDFITSYHKNLHLELSPVAAVVGGVVGQDILNVIGKQHQPIQNFFVFDGNRNEGPIFLVA